MAALHGTELGLSPVVVLLLGEKNSGKSSVGNTILGRRAFNKKTTHSSKETGTVFGKQVTVVDTPGWLSHSTTPDRVSQELYRGLTLCHARPDVILLVLPTTTIFSQDVWKDMEAQLRLLQTPIWQRAIILFTHGDKLGGVSIQEHIRRQGQILRWLLERCGNRFQVMSNQSGASHAQVTELFLKIRKMVEVNERPREIQNRMYTQLRREVSLREERRWQGRREVSLREERRWQGRREVIEMTVMDDVHDGRPSRRQRISSGWQRMSRGVPARPAGFKPALGLILLGRRRSGKSSAGNLILDREEFQTNTKTTRCSVGHGEVSGWSVTVVDTPGWSLFNLSNPNQVRTEMRRSLTLCPVGSTVAFLLAVPVDSFREKDRRAVETYLGVLGINVWRSTVVLFTYEEELRGKTIEEHIEKKGKPLQWLLDRCGHRHHVFHTGDETEVRQLLELVERLSELVPVQGTKCQDISASAGGAALNR